MNPNLSSDCTVGGLEFTQRGWQLPRVLSLSPCGVVGWQLPRVLIYPLAECPVCCCCCCCCWRQAGQPSPLTRQNWYGQDPVLGHALACWHLGGRRREMCEYNRSTHTHTHTHTRTHAHARARVESYLSHGSWKSELWQFSSSVGWLAAASRLSQRVMLWKGEQESNLTPSKPFSTTVSTHPA